MLDQTGYDELLDLAIFIDAREEPSTFLVNNIRNMVLERGFVKPSAVIGFGGGSTLDVAKAIANLLTNFGDAENYQGWDLLKNPSIFKIGVPTISGTGAEATRTCVMINPLNGMKLGMNSDYTVMIRYLRPKPNKNCS